MRNLIILAALAIGAALSAPASASEAVPAAMSQHLDKAPAEFTMTAAKQRRLYMIDQANRQQRYGRPGYGPRPGYARPGYGPRPGYGYGPRPGYRHGPRW